ncbi:Phage tail tube protein FII [Paracoccus haematequi]|uniref:Phage tail tube protein FII n=1 Tax=Paracoccus haematequi TaxID=2491866 RepID=A0A3S4CZS9_9RHOB|nr:phage major tail tube protein [Paracoccus haematequi]VDS09242.1 Phage tail tube protein FII [Paracoccus haematequi]
MSLPKTIRNFNAFVDGISYFGLATEAKMPWPKIQTEAHRGSGMDGPVGQDMGMEGMSAEATFAEWSPALLKRIGTETRVVFRPAAKADGAATAETIIATVSGLVTGHEGGDLKPGTGATLKLTWDVRQYRLEINNEVIWDIDLVAGKRVVGGVDQLAALRRAMGI